MENFISKQLIEHCKNGDRRSQKELYLLTIDRFRNIGWRYSFNNDDALDIVQNTYLMIFRSLDKYDDNKGSFYTWSTKIIVNEALQLLRKRSKIMSDDFNDNLYVEHSDMNLEKYTIDEIKRVVGQMNPAHRVIFNMYFFDEFTYREIAEILNIKESSTRANVSRAKKAFLDVWKKIDNSMAL